MKNCLTCKNEPDWVDSRGKCKPVLLAEPEDAVTLIKYNNEVYGELGRITRCDGWISKRPEAGIQYHATGPNKTGKHTGYVSIDGLPSLCTVQMYSTSEEAIAAIKKLTRHKKSAKSA